MELEETLTNTTTGELAKKSWKPWHQYDLPIEALTSHSWRGAGTEESPFIVDWLPADAENPMTWSNLYKWFLVATVSIATLAVSFDSSAYSGGVRPIITELNTSEELVTAGISFFVLGFALGPLLWAPISEVLGRRLIFVGTYGMLTVFIAATAGAQNIQTILILRFFAGAFGSSPLTNAGGTIADIFPARQRGLAMGFFSAAPFLGPAIGPIVGGFVGQSIGWRWVEGVMAIFTGVLWIFGTLVLPETYPPALLRRRAKRLSTATGHVYRSKMEEKEVIALPKLLKTALSRPWILLFREPIVLLLSIYLAIIYGTLYMMFAAFPVVYQEGYGWSQGIGGLAFVGVAVGIVLAVIYTLFDNKRYSNILDKAEKEGHSVRASPEARLPPGMLGCVFLPIGLFWFAWTNGPSVFWLVSIVGTGFFGFGMVLTFLSVMNYLIDSYTIYAASVLAANSVLRSLFGAAFPLFTTKMYNNLGVHLASTVPAILAAICVPFLFVFYRYGERIRKTCKYSREADELMEEMLQAQSPNHSRAPSTIHEVAGGLVEGEEEKKMKEDAV